MSLTRDLPRYQCHKQVQALKIRLVLPNPRGVELHFEDERFCPIEMDAKWAGKHLPMDGGYFVIYADGYVSFSPAEAFEAGYTLIEDVKKAGIVMPPSCRDQVRQWFVESSPGDASHTLI